MKLKMSVPSLRKNSKVGEDKTVLFRVNPGPDPKRAMETEWLTKDQIMEETYKLSHTFVDIGSGNLARIFLEILGCDHLHNLYVTGKTDPFVCIVYEDAIVQKDCVEDKLSPRWMPWTQRAFILHMMHPSSQIFIGVFDRDVILHEFVWSVAVDITNLSPNLDYLLHYNLTTLRF